MKYEEMIKGYEDSMDEFSFYRRLCAPNDNTPSHTFAGNETVLRYWAENKQDLYEMMGHQLILSKPITVAAPRSELRNAMADVVNRSNFVTCLSDALCKDCLGDDADDNLREFYYSMRNTIFSGSELINNSFPYDFTVRLNGSEKPIRFSHGQKITRILGRLAAIYNLEDDYEDFRIAHSQVMNTSKLSGELCLSIHPLDYATASDNACGWNSCMSWDDRGCYRLGTVEMMNSPIVICAYLHNPKHTYGLDWSKNSHQWNSKKWRAWIIVHPEVILVNRNYPYPSDELSIAALQWAQELAENYYGVKYTEEPSINWSEYNCDLYTNYMYNDICTEQWHVGTKELLNRHDLCISGPANCMWCGDLIEFEGDSDRAATLICDDCGAFERCCECGAILNNPDYIYYDDHGNAYCSDCWESCFAFCHLCDRDVRVEDMIHVRVPSNTLSRCFYVNLCRECAFEGYNENSFINANEFYRKYDTSAFAIATYWGNKPLYYLNPNLPYSTVKEIMDNPYCFSEDDWDYYVRGCVEDVE